MQKLIVCFGAILCFTLGSLGCGKKDPSEKGGADAAARAKTAEAIDHIDKLSKAASMYFTSARVSPDGAMLPCQFPKTVACTPAANPCASPNKRFRASAKAWTHPTWSALMFQMGAEHYYQYCFESSGTGANAKAIITAHGDLDCDGTKSTFSRTITGEVGATSRDCNAATGDLKVVDRLE